MHIVSAWQTIERTTYPQEEKSPNFPLPEFYTLTIREREQPTVSVLNMQK